MEAFTARAFTWSVESLSDGRERRESNTASFLPLREKSGQSVDEVAICHSE